MQDHSYIVHWNFHKYLYPNVALLLAHKGLSQRNLVTIYVDGQRDIFLIFKQGLANNKIGKPEIVPLKITSAKPKNTPSVRNNLKPTVGKWILNHGKKYARI